MILRMKLLQFAENVRPAYYGTFTKQSCIVNSRRPFAQDIDKFDYDIDSEAEWEPEGEGEDIHSGDEDDDDPNTDMIDPEDAGWLVPEGYLSDNEGVEEGDRQQKLSKPSDLQNSSKRIAFRKIVLGPFFEGEAAMEDEAMRPFETQFMVDVPREGFNPFYKEPVSCSPNNNTASPASTPHKIEFTDEHTNALISVINEKSSENIPDLINEAKANSVLKDVSKRLLAAKIKNIAVKEKRGTNTVSFFFVVVVIVGTILLN
ncbi:chromatin assembly factor 1 subunit A-domain-containing protein [Parasitella parasitica]|nr:chromatin assembly factor 1 subunit A-domain-containing protein [Parasitella parasitica]